MARTSYPFAGGSGSTVNQAQWEAMAKWWLRDGIVSGDLNELKLSATTGLTVQVDTGTAWIQGCYFHNDTAWTQALNAADPSNPRIDRIVLQVNFSGYLVDFLYLPGTPAPSPVAPALTRSASVWQISLGQILVGTGVGTVTNSNITDERSSIDLCGYAWSQGPAALSNSTVRPSTFPVGGMIYEQDTQHVKLNTGTYTTPVWSDIIAGGASLFASEQYTNQTGSAITLAHTFLAVLSVEVNGVAWLQGSGANQWSLSGATLTFGTALAGDDVRVVGAVSSTFISGAAQGFHDSFTATASQTNFLLTATPACVLMVTKNGTALAASAYGIATNTLTLHSAAAANDDIEVAYITSGGGTGNATTLNGLTTSGAGSPTAGTLVATDATTGLLPDSILGYATIASATTLPMGKMKHIYVTGTTAMTDLSNPPQAGDECVLVFQSAGVAISSQNHWVTLNGVPFTSVANGVLRGIIDGSGNFNEVYRSPGQGGVATTVLYDKVLTADAGSITIAVPAGAGRHLRLWVNGRTDYATNTDLVGLQFNGDTLTHYSNSASPSATAIEQMVMASAFNAAGYSYVSTAYIPDYAGTTFTKVVGMLSYGDDGTYGQASPTHGSWNQTAAVTSIKLFPVRGTVFKSGSSFRLVAE